MHLPALGREHVPGLMKIVDFGQHKDKSSKIWWAERVDAGVRSAA